MKYSPIANRDENGVMQKEGVKLEHGNVCAGCNHTRLTHIGGCFAKGCKCKKYIDTIKR